VSRRYALVVGEALVDLLDTGDGHYREAVGGAPLNVAVGVVRLGGAAEFAGAVGRDVLGRRVLDFCARTGVGTTGCVTVDGPTAIALTTFDGSEPDFHFYGDPPSYGRFGPDHLDRSLVAGAAVLHCGSIALLRPDSLAAARVAWSVPGPLKTFDPNVRASLLADPAAYREVVAGFAAGADLVKLSAADAQALYGTGTDEAAEVLLAAGAGAVAVTLGPRGLLLAVGRDRFPIEAPAVSAVDATGAGDSVMAAFLAGALAAGGLPTDATGWHALGRLAVCVAALVVAAPGGATAMPTLAAVRQGHPGVAEAAGLG
jgi:fructokinase